MIVRVANYEEWRRLAKAALAREIAPKQITFLDESAPALLPGLSRDEFSGEATRTVNVPRAFLLALERARYHSDPERWTLFYSILWRLVHGQPKLLSDESDRDTHALRTLERAVASDVHRMHAFVRFRKIDASVKPLYAAWYRPDHDILELAAPHFVARHKELDWMIVTPQRSVLYKAFALEFGPGARPPRSDSEDEYEALFAAYYRATFNATRFRPKALTHHVPGRFQTQLSEMQSLPELVRNVPDKLRVIQRSESTESARTFIPDERSISALKAAAQHCQGCTLYEHASQTVFGEGPASAEVVLIGEQPGDMEDTAGRPFVGPAGQVLDAALAEVALSRERLYLTNAVKHFRFRWSGKTRLHQQPKPGDVRACRPWLVAELETIRPKAIVCLGATAARALFGTNFRVSQARGQIFATAWAPYTFATWHPSAVLRAESLEDRSRLYTELTADLALLKCCLAP